MAIKSKAAAAALALGAAVSSAAAEMSSDRQIINVINSVGFYADQNDWDAVAEQFHPDGAVLDYTSYANASAGTSDALPTLLPQQIVDAWQTVLPGYERTQHVMGTEIVKVDGET
ncbi:MAG: nuclear transport factor 2 family protein, partial [Pseudomonadota bacterium]